MPEPMYDGKSSTDDPRMLPLLLNVRQAAELLNVSEKHVRDLCAAGRIKAVRVGRSWRVGRDALLEQFEIAGIRGRAKAPLSMPTGGYDEDRVEVVIRVELPAELAGRLADARVVVTSAASPGTGSGRR